MSAVGTIVTRLGLGYRARIVANASGMVRLQYIDGPLRGRQVACHADELATFWTRASYPPARRAA